MAKKIWNLYLSGEIHTNWRDEIRILCEQKGLPVIINSPNTIHEDSDDCGVNILGKEVFVNEDDAGSVIMKAREHWFQEEITEKI